LVSNSDTFLPQEVIRRKRDGAELSPEEIEAFVGAITSGQASEGQLAALAMAIFFRGMNPAECGTLTLAMRDSGEVINWDRHRLHGPVVDKHSTGGVGDCVSLILAPLLAACGTHVPMISGRGLGHTGGTLDKLASIPGYNARPDPERFQQVVKNVGCAIIGQTGTLAPADGRLYGVRDVTATVESVPLITASILSKKLASGLDALVMDIKTGNGAFAASEEMALELANSIVSVANGVGVPTVAVITDMNQPLAPVAGNALEVWEAVDYLTGERRDPLLHQVTLRLGGELLVAAGRYNSLQEAERALQQALTSGAAAERFAAMVSALGGPDDLLERPGDHLERAPVERSVTTSTDGRVAAIDTRALGMAVVRMGGGRRKADDEIDPRVGISGLPRVGDTLQPGERLGRIHARSKEQAREAEKALRSAITLDRGEHPSPSLIKRVVYH
jgi:thymidine phosphorylase